MEGAIFADYGTDLGSGHTVPGESILLRPKVSSICQFDSEADELEIG